MVARPDRLAVDERPVRCRRAGPRTDCRRVWDAATTPGRSRAADWARRCRRSGGSRVATSSPAPSPTCSHASDMTIPLTPSRRPVSSRTSSLSATAFRSAPITTGRSVVGSPRHSCGEVEEASRLALSRCEASKRWSRWVEATGQRPHGRHDVAGDHPAMARRAVTAGECLVGDRLDGPPRQHRIGEADTTMADRDGPHAWNPSSSPMIVARSVSASTHTSWRHMMSGRHDAGSRRSHTAVAPTPRTATTGSRSSRALSHPVPTGRRVVRRCRSAVNRWEPIGPGAGRLELRRDPEQQRLVVDRPDELHPDRQAAGAPVERE